MKADATAVMNAIGAALPGARVVVLIFDDENPTVDVAFNVNPAHAAAAMRDVGTNMCDAMQIPSPKSKPSTGSGRKR